MCPLVFICVSTVEFPFEQCGNSRKHSRGMSSFLIQFSSIVSRSYTFFFLDAFVGIFVYTLESIFMLHFRGRARGSNFAFACFASVSLSVSLLPFFLFISSCRCFRCPSFRPTSLSLSFLLCVSSPSSLYLSISGSFSHLQENLPSPKNFS